MNPITFPNLNISIDISNVAFSIFGKDIYWYGLIITLGIVFAVFLAYLRLNKKEDNKKLKENKISKDNKFGFSFDDITDFVLLAIPLGIIFARLYYVIFSFDSYIKNPIEIIQIWNGGLAIYGGIIGGIFSCFIFCKIKKKSFLDLTDFCAPYLALCQSIGRWGNFFNREAYGSITDSFFKMGIPNTKGEYFYYHPTFLYESVANLIVFIILINLSNKRKFKGQIFYLYLILYGIIRFFIEGLRLDSLYLFSTGIRVSQALSIVLAIIGIVLYLKSRKSKDFSKRK